MQGKTVIKYDKLEIILKDSKRNESYEFNSTVKLEFSDVTYEINGGAIIISKEREEDDVISTESKCYQLDEIIAFKSYKNK